MAYSFAPFSTPLPSYHVHVLPSHVSRLFKAGKEFRIQHGLGNGVRKHLYQKLVVPPCPVQPLPPTAFLSVLIYTSLKSNLPVSFQEDSFLIWKVLTGDVSSVVCKLKRGNQTVGPA